MQRVKTIEQRSTIYTIGQMGNRSFRVSYRRTGERRVMHVMTVFDSADAAEAYIKSCANADAICEMATISGRQLPRQTNDSPIARMRIARGMTQQQLADAIGVKQKDVTRWERGVYSPRVEKLQQIAAALQCKLEDLVREED